MRLFTLYSGCNLTNKQLIVQPTRLNIISCSIPATLLRLVLGESGPRSSIVCVVEALSLNNNNLPSAFLEERNLKLYLRAGGDTEAGEEGGNKEAICIIGKEGKAST